MRFSLSFNDIVISTMDTEDLPLFKEAEKEGKYLYYIHINCYLVVESILNILANIIKIIYFALLGGIKKCATSTWKCLSTCSTITMLLLSLGMFVVGVKIWVTINGHFDIATSYDDVICFTCIKYLTVSTIIFVIGSALTLSILCCCYATKLHKFNFGLLITIFCTVAGVIAIIIVITTPIWFSKQSDIVQKFEESSKSSFRKQINDASIRDTWDDYQSKFGCCGVQDYKDYYKYFGQNYSIPISCCNFTTLTSANIDCSAIVQKVTDEDISSYYVYGTGCPYVIVDKLNLNSTIIHDVAIGITVCSGFVFVSVFTVFVFTMIAIPEDRNQLFCLIATIFITLYAIIKACSSGSSHTK